MIGNFAFQKNPDQPARPAAGIYTGTASASRSQKTALQSVGVRLEIPQTRIDTAQWGGFFPNIGKASFRLTRREEENARACYTFCMCPGGLVIA
jgi:uncharacterized FAD-dependent dehydrogenase